MDLAVSDPRAHNPITEWEDAMDDLLLCSGDPEGVHLIVGYECRHCGESLRAIARAHRFYSLRKDWDDTLDDVNYGVLGNQYPRREKEKKDR